MKTKIFTALTLVSLIGCSSQEVKKIETEYVDYNRDVVVLELKDVGQKIQEAMMIMARNDNAIKSEVMSPEKIRIANFNATYIPPGMERVIQFNWKGPAMKALEALSKYVDYKFVPGGTKPVTMLEPIVFIDEKDKNVIDLIRLIESQTKGQLSLNIREHQGKQRLEVNYVR
jgi:hypothetical protein